MNKLYPTRINWHNEPSTETPIDEINLNKMDKFCDDIDNRVIEIDGRVTNIEDIEPTVLGYATRAENAANDSEGYAVGKRGGQDVPSTDPTYHNNSKYYSDRALTSETNAATSETNAATSESNASTSETNAHTSETNAADSAETAEAYAIGERNGEPVTSEDVTYHNNSKYYAEQAGTSATNAATSESNASTSETNAATSESNAATSESNAATSETNAATSESNAEAWAVGERGGVPVTSEDETYENNAKFYSGNADTKAEFADLRAVDSEAWSVGKRRGEPVLPSDETYHNNAKYWAEIAESVTNVFPMEGATDSTNGKGGLVPQPLAGDNKKALYGDGTWKDVKGRTWLAYIREYGTPFAANWLTLSPTGGVALTPDTEDLYLIKSSGKYYNVAVSWNGTAYEVTSKSAHIIVDEDGVSYPQRDKMKFFNAVIEDDELNDTTNVYVEGTGSIIVTPPTVTVGTYTYNGQPQGPTIVWATGMEDKCVVTNATKTDAGTYTLTIALKNSNRMIWTDMTTADKTYSYTIAKQTLTVPTVDDTGLVYDGTAQSPTITGFDSDTMTKSGDTETDAGSYTVTFGLVDSDNYQWGGTNTVAWSIAKANQTITLSSNSVTLDGTNPTATVTVSGNQGTISASSSNTSKATVSVSGTTVTISRVGTSGTNANVTITVTAAATSNYNSTSATVSASVVYDVPNGATVTPTNDIQTWLHCASIWNKNYTTISQVLSDTSTLSSLISSNNAVDYMVRSTNWASSVCGNSTAMSYIGLNNYCSNTLLANSTWCTAICNSSYFESVLTTKVPTMTSNTTPSGEVIYSSYLSPNCEPWYAFDNNDNDGWISQRSENNSFIAYRFTKTIKAKKAIIMSSTSKSVKIVAKNYLSENWTTIVDNISLSARPELKIVNFPTNNTSYVYYGIQFKEVMYVDDGNYTYIQKLQFYGR